ncbi:MAG TPA: D-TA family PLP-dependent enzyme [Verrucomicrobia bacterium]|nr:D-TA family PLP-dependent enzyme [Verrucomicrobiales bacterium]HIL56237.1 D-TA family PLP-dependent enzyme [Verrucomicrobiota bacterium]
MNWPKIDRLESIPSPALLVDPGKISANIDQMIRIAGDNFKERLRPHLKTHKMRKITQLQIDKGINQFKAATIAEATMAAQLGAKDILLAYQPVGPNLNKFGELIDNFPESSFAAIVDNLESAKTITSKIGNSSNPVRLFIDINCGMNRTGISFNGSLGPLREWIEKEPRVTLSGLHIYDGHLHQPELKKRRDGVIKINDSIKDYIGINSVPEIIVGGSPTFGLWAEQSDWNLSPGTVLLWDAGYARAFPDLNFSIASCLLTRVISKPEKNLICVDLGHKSVAAENPLHDRVFFPDLSDYEIIGQSEEHLVIKTHHSEKYDPGHLLLGFPKHICPTVALHSHASVINDNVASTETWEVNARNRI